MPSRNVAMPMVAPSPPTHLPRWGEGGDVPDQNGCRAAIHASTSRGAAQLFSGSRARHKSASKYADAYGEPGSSGGAYPLTGFHEVMRPSDVHKLAIQVGGGAFHAGARSAACSSVSRSPKRPAADASAAVKSPGSG